MSQTTNSPRASRMLDVEDVATELKVSKRKVWKMKAMKQIPSPVRLGRAVRWDSKAIDRWISAGCPSQAEDSAKGGLGE